MSLVAHFAMATGQIQMEHTFAAETVAEGGVVSPEELHAKHIARADVLANVEMRQHGPLRAEDPTGGYDSSGDEDEDPQTAGVEGCNNGWRRRRRGRRRGL